jgi:hypothetical protein
MKAQDFKKLIKEAVREAIQEELKDILLEAVRAPKLTLESTPIGVGGTGVTNPSVISQPSATSAIERKAMLENILGDMRRGQDTISMTTANLNTFQPPAGANFAAEGSKLPEGNVGLDQIMALMNGK